MQDAQALEMAVGQGSQRKDEAESSNGRLTDLAKNGRFNEGRYLNSLYCLSMSFR